jgi:hypothetical protein
MAERIYLLRYGGEEYRLEEPPTHGLVFTDPGWLKFTLHGGKDTVSIATGHGIPVAVVETTAPRTAR